VANGPLMDGLLTVECANCAWDLCGLAKISGQDHAARTSEDHPR